MKSLFLTTLLVLFSLTIHAAEIAPYKVGVSTLKVESKMRPLTGHIWYPTLDKQEEKLIGGNPVWHGFKQFLMPVLQKVDSLSSSFHTVLLVFQKINPGWLLLLLKKDILSHHLIILELHTFNATPKRVASSGSAQKIPAEQSACF